MADNYQLDPRYAKLSKILGIDPTEQLDPSDVINAAGRASDAVGGAPVRAAAGALQAGGGLGDMAKAYGKQFGANPDEAPTGEDLVGNDPITAPYKNTLLPAVTSTALDPMNALSVMQAAKAAKALPAVESAVQGLGKGAAADMQAMSRMSAPGNVPYVYRAQNGLLSAKESGKDLAELKQLQSANAMAESRSPEWKDMQLQNIKKYLGGPTSLPPPTLSNVIEPTTPINFKPGAINSDKVEDALNNLRALHAGNLEDANTDDIVDILKKARK